MLKHSRKNIYTLYKGNNKKILRKFKDESIHVCISDVPYGLSLEVPDANSIIQQWASGKDYRKHTKKASQGYLNSKWDSFVPQPSLWREIYRVLKPGGWCIAFFSTRTYDLGVMSMRMAGFDVRDQIFWIYDRTSPKSHNIGRSIDRKHKVDLKKYYKINYFNPQTKDAKKWINWGTSLRPICDPIVLARKPLHKNSVVDNVLLHGVGALNIDGCRIPVKDDKPNFSKVELSKKDIKNNSSCITVKNGRYPTQIIMDRVSGKLLDSTMPREISKFFFCPKVSKKEREDGCDSLTTKVISSTHNVQPLALKKNYKGERRANLETKNYHPTVKPIKLMRYLVRLVAPKGSKVIDPFMGTGTTGIACLHEGVKFIGIEVDKGYYKIAKARMSHYHNKVKKEKDDLYK